jgi:hypothetical protein
LCCESIFVTCELSCSYEREVVKSPPKTLPGEQLVQILSMSPPWQVSSLHALNAYPSPQITRLLTAITARTVPDMASTYLFCEKMIIPLMGKILSVFRCVPHTAVTLDTGKISPQANHTHTHTHSTCSGVEEPSEVRSGSVNSCCRRHADPI